MRTNRPPLIGVLAATLVLVGFFLVRGFIGHREVPQAATDIESIPPASPPEKVGSGPGEKADELVSVLRAERAGLVAMISEQSRDLVQKLCYSLERGSAFDESAIEAWKGHRQALIDQGTTAVSAIHEFLRKDLDIEFSAPMQKTLGYASARKALFEVLSAIGGEESISVVRETLSSTADPREVAVLAKTLEEMAPGRYGHEALAATRETLALAASGKLRDFDVAPLFEVMQKMGGSEVVEELVTASKNWNYYSAISLAELPEGAGLQSLIEMSRDKSGSSRSLAQQMLAQMSVQYPEARDALLEQVRAGQIESSTWPYLTRLLAGGKYTVRDAVFDASLVPVVSGRSSTVHISSGNQNLQVNAYQTPTAPGQLQTQIAFLDQLNLTTSNPIAKKTIADARQLLTQAQNAPR